MGVTLSFCANTRGKGGGRKRRGPKEEKQKGKEREKEKRKAGKLVSKIFLLIRRNYCLIWVIARGFPSDLWVYPHPRLSFLFHLEGKLTQLRNVVEVI